MNSAVANDDFVYDVVPDLAYTCNPVVYEFLKGIIGSDQPICHSSDPDSNDKLICGYRVIEMIAPYLQGFPIQTDEDGELILPNHSGLMQVREWFQTNPELRFSKNVF